ncbi:MAG: hypothetical protein KatS3mg087_0507 [Patescibacteria group bacterium]|nr:MAG: hypothetical protein KatS3mg087_0507 [Patescibacteria group bacterium]
MKRKIDKQLRAEVVAFRAAGWSKRKIADHYGLTLKQIDKILDRVAQDQPDLETTLRTERLSTMEQIDSIIETLSEQAKSGDQRAMRNLLEAIRLKSDLLGLKEQTDITTRANRAWKEIAKQISLFKQREALDTPVIDIKVVERSEYGEEGGYDDN